VKQHAVDVCCFVLALIPAFVGCRFLGHVCAHVPATEEPQAESGEATPEEVDATDSYDFVRVALWVEDVATCVWGSAARGWGVFWRRRHRGCV